MCCSDCLSQDLLWKESGQKESAQPIAVALQVIWGSVVSPWSQDEVDGLFGSGEEESVSAGEFVPEGREAGGRIRESIATSTVVFLSHAIIIIREGDFAARLQPL